MAAQSPLTVVTWNIFHGRDAPPDPRLLTLRSRLLRITEEDGVYAQVNRSLRNEFAGVIAGARWDVCLLQEVPPQWTRVLGERSGAASLRTLVARNQLRPVMGWLGEWNPDLIGSWEGSANAVLVRSPWQPVRGVARSLIMNPFPERGLGERRRATLVRLRHADTGAEVCLANLHASGNPVRARGEIARAAVEASRFAGVTPLVFGGDLNLRLRSSPQAFEALEREHRLVGPTAPDAIDHLLTRDLDVPRAPSACAPERREIEIALPQGARRVRLSDHPPVVAELGLRPAAE